MTTTADPTTALTLDHTDEVCALLRDTAFLNMRNGEPAGIPYLNTTGIVRAHTVWAFIAIRIHHLLNEYKALQEEAESMHEVWNHMANELYVNPIDVVGADGQREAEVLCRINDLLSNEENEIVQIYWLTFLLDAVMRTTTDYAIDMFEKRGEDRWEGAMNACKSLTVSICKRTEEVRNALMED